MRNTIYVVEFDGNKLLNGDFDFKEEALEWAEEHLTEKPIVKAIDLEIDEDGNSTVYDEEELFHYPVEEVEEVEAEEISDVEEDDVLKELSDFANSIDVKQDSPIEDEVAAEKWFTMADEADVDLNDEVFDEDLDVNSSARDVASELNATLNNWDIGLDEEVKPEENLEEDVILFDPFGCDFSECEPMEVCSDNHRADCCKDFNVRAVDFFKELAAELGLEDEVEISEKNVEEPVETVPVDDGNGGVKDVCPNCGNEIPCEDRKDEISEISDEVKIEEPVVAEDEVKVEVAPEAEVAAEEDIVPEEVKANEEPNVEVQAEDEKPAEEISKCHVCPECGKEICECDKQKLVEAENLIDDTEGKDDLINALREDTHPEEAQPEVDHVKAFNAALEVAKKENKPVIYGYMGADHHGKNRYFEIEHIVCDDLNSCRQQVMNRYHPNGSVLVAYPDKEFIEEGLILGEDLEILTEGPLGWLSKAAKTVAGGVKKAAGAIADTAKKGVQAVGNAVKNDLLGTDGTDLDKEFKKYQVKGFEGDTGSEAKETKTFTKFMDANNYAVEYSKQDGKRAYIYPSGDGTSFNRDILAKYEKGKISENHIKDILANFAKAKQDTKDAKKAEDQKKKDDAKLAAAAGKSEEGKAEAAEKEKKEKAKAGIAAMAGMKPEEVTDEMISKFNELVKSFKPAATESLAEEIPNSELEDKMLFIEEQEEMSDLELAKAVFEAHNKKHNCK